MVFTSQLSSKLRRSFMQALRETSRGGGRRVPIMEQLEERRLLATVSLSPIADASLYQDATGADANGIGQHLFAGVTAQNSDALRRALLKFDVASAIPSGATINSVSLRLTTTKVPSPIVATNMSLHEVRADWGEGTTDANGQEGTGGNSTPNSATWLHRFFTTSTWATAGGDFDSTASASSPVSGLGDYVWTGSGLVADVQGWINAPNTQFGWLLKSVDEVTLKSAKRFGSRENPLASARPLLTIDYTEISNKAPTLDAITNPPEVLEDAPAQIVNLTGISAGQGESQALTVTATSSNPTLIPNPTVTYTSPNTTGSLSYAPLANQSGAATITVTVRDNGGTASGGVDTFTRTFTVTVNPVNDAPAIDAIADPAAILEDAGLQTINLTGISAGPAETQTLTVTAVSSNPSLIPNPSVNYVSAATTGSLSYTPLANQSGTATITVTVQDNGGTLSGGIDLFMRTFTISVTPVNDAPALDAIANPGAILEDADIQTLNLSGISAGGNESQTITVSAVSSNPGLIANPTVSYASPASTGSLTFTPLANQFGTATITVTVQDNGGTLNGGIDLITRTFTVTVNPVNDAPTLDSIAAPPPLLEDASLQTLNLSGISAGPNETQPLAISAVSNNPGLIADPTVTYTSPNATGSISYAPRADQFGQATITVTVSDGGLDGNLSTVADNATTIRLINVSVSPVNDLPTLDALTNVRVAENDSEQTISLTGISAGGGETQPLRVSVQSSIEAIVPTPSIEYTSANPTGLLRFKPATGAKGSSTIKVTVEDGGLDNDLATGADNGHFERSFGVLVGIVNESPTLDALANKVIDEDAAEQIVGLSGITAGLGEVQNLRITTSSSNTNLIPNPTVSYTSPASTGQIRFTPASNAHGSASIVIRVTDDGPDGDFATVNDNATLERTLSVTVNSVNDAPQAVADSFNVHQETKTVLNLLSNDTDIDSVFDTSKFEFRDGPARGTLTVSAGGTVEYSPNTSYFGADAFSYRVADVEGAFTDWTKVDLAVNARPLAKNDLAFLKFGAATDTDILANDGDPDGITQNLEIIVVTSLNPAIGQVTVTSQKLLRFTPGPSFDGLVQIAYQLRDSLGAVSNEAVASLGVYNQNPVLVEDVDNSKFVSPIDVLLIINQINLDGSVPIQPGNSRAPFLDTSADGILSALDALLVINYLNANSPSGEGELSPGSPSVSALNRTPSNDVHSLLLTDSEWSSSEKDSDEHSSNAPSTRVFELTLNPLPSPSVRNAAKTGVTDEVFATLDEWLSDFLS